MTGMVLTPATGTLPTTEGVLSGTTVSAGEEWRFDIYYSNTTTAAISCRLGGTPNGGTTINEIVPDKPVPANDVLVVKGVFLPAGWALTGRAGAAGVSYFIIPVRRLALFP